MKGLEITDVGHSLTRQLIASHTGPVCSPFHTLYRHGTGVVVVTRVIEAVAMDDITSPGSAVAIVSLFTNSAIRLFIFPG